MKKNFFLQDIISVIDFSDLPHKYITAASVTDEHGLETVYTSNEIEKMFNDDISPTADVAFMLDVQKIYRDTKAEYFHIFDQINELITEKYDIDK